MDRNCGNESITTTYRVALRKESVDRNDKRVPELQVCGLSLSARRAWIEMSTVRDFVPPLSVALRKESVDRNKTLAQRYRATRVALRKESVDRNNTLYSSATDLMNVALRKESVDRNTPWPPRSPRRSRSLSARRAWIEIARA